MDTFLYPPIRKRAVPSASALRSYTYSDFTSLVLFGIGSIAGFRFVTCYYCQGLTAPGNTTLQSTYPIHTAGTRVGISGYYAFCRVARMCADATCFGAGRSRRVSLTRTCSVLGFSDDNERQRYMLSHDSSNFLLIANGPKALRAQRDAPDDHSRRPVTFEPWPRSVDSKTHAA